MSTGKGPHWTTLPWKRLLALAGAFLIGALPWLVRLMTRWQHVIADLFGRRVGETAATSQTLVGIADRALSLLFFALPSLVGLRPPWAFEWVLLPLGVAAAVVYLIALWRAARRIPGEAGYRQVALLSLLLAWAVIVPALLLSPFGIDPTGRYLMPLYVPLILLTVDWLGEVYQRGEGGRWLGAGLLVLLVGYNLFGVVRFARRNPPGLTTQFDLISHIPHSHDDELMAFLAAQDIEQAYTNFWITFRFAFLTGERVQFAPLLPYKADLSYTYRDNRRPPYTDAVRNADAPPAYITSNLPELDARLRRAFDAAGIDYQVDVIGPYTVFYDLSRHIQPEQLDIYGAVSRPAD